MPSSATVSIPSPEPSQTRGSGLGRRRSRRGEQFIVGVLGGFAFISVLTTVAIVVALFRPAIEFFSDVSFGDFLTGTKWSPLFQPPRFGVLPILVGTVVTTACALVVCIPLGLGCAVYLSEYARPRVRKTVKPVLEILAGIPTVVYGYFAVKFVSPYVQDLWPFGAKPGAFNALSAGLVMGIMILPILKAGFIEPIQNQKRTWFHLASTCEECQKTHEDVRLKVFRIHSRDLKECEAIAAQPQQEDSTNFHHLKKNES